MQSFYFLLPLESSSCLRSDSMNCWRESKINFSWAADMLLMENNCHLFFSPMSSCLIFLRQTTSWLKAFWKINFWPPSEKQVRILMIRKMYLEWNNKLLAQGLIFSGLYEESAWKKREVLAQCMMGARKTKVCLSVCSLVCKCSIIGNF